MLRGDFFVSERETFASRLGFVLISAGCAIGLGNVWRFPYIVGQYGGAAFVLIYIMFLLIMWSPAVPFPLRQNGRTDCRASLRAGSQ